MLSFCGQPIHPTYPQQNAAQCDAFATAKLPYLIIETPLKFRSVTSSVDQQKPKTRNRIIYLLYCLRRKIASQQIRTV